MILFLFAPIVIVFLLIGGWNAWLAGRYTDRETNTVGKILRTGSRIYGYASVVFAFSPVFLGVYILYQQLPEAFLLFLLLLPRLGVLALAGVVLALATIYWFRPVPRKIHPAFKRG